MLHFHQHNADQRATRAAPHKTGAMERFPNPRALKLSRDYQAAADKEGKNSRHIISTPEGLLILLFDNASPLVGASPFSKHLVLRGIDIRR